MINPEQSYTRHRDLVEEPVGTCAKSYTDIRFLGTVSDPWAVDSITTVTDPKDQTYVTRDMYDVVTIDWHKRLARGEIINNPMEQTSIAWNRGSGLYQVYRTDRHGTSPDYYYTGQHLTGTNCIGDTSTSTSWSYPDVPSIDVQSVIDLAITEAWSRVSLNEAELLVQIAEFDKTVAFLVSIFKRAYKILKAVKKLEMRKLLKEISPSELKNRYLEARYALRPLMYDAAGILKAINGIKKGAEERQTFRAWKMGSTDSQSTNVLLRSSAGNYEVRGWQYASRVLECRAGVLTAIENASFPITIWGVTEPIQAVWDIIPFSFIIDWFCNIGNVIASWSPKIGLKKLASWYVVTDTTTLVSTAVPEQCVDLTSHNYENWYYQGGTYSKVIVNKYRLPEPSRPILPHWDVNLNWLKTLDLAAIASNFFKLKNNQRL